MTLAPSTTTRMQVGVVRYWTRVHRVEVTLTFDGGFSKFMHVNTESVFYGKKGVLRKVLPDTCMAMESLPTMRIPSEKTTCIVGDSLDQDDWYRRGIWANEGEQLTCKRRRAHTYTRHSKRASVWREEHQRKFLTMTHAGVVTAMYDRSISCSERDMILEQLLGFLKEASFLVDNEVSERHNSKNTLFEISRKGGYSDCRWPDKLLVCVDSLDIADNTQSLSDRLNEAFNLAVHNDTDIILQFPWVNCSEKLCSCINCMPRSKYRPSLIWDKHYRNNMLSNGPLTEIQTANKWMQQPRNEFGLQQHCTYYPQMFPYVLLSKSDQRSRWRAILQVMYSFLGDRLKHLAKDLARILVHEHGAMLIDLPIISRNLHFPDERFLYMANISILD